MFLTPCGRVITDDDVRKIYQLLVGSSFESPEHFEVLQEAWNKTAAILGVDGIRDNGHGPVRWSPAMKEENRFA